MSANFAIGRESPKPELLSPTSSEVGAFRGAAARRTTLLGDGDSEQLALAQRQHFGRYNP